MNWGGECLSYNVFREVKLRPFVTWRRTANREMSIDCPHVLFKDSRCSVQQVSIKKVGFNEQGSQTFNCDAPGLSAEGFEGM